MKFLVFQHINVEHPGIFRDFMREDGITWDTVELDQGEPIPDLNQYNGLLVMGGPMDVWEEDKYSWLVREKQAIRDAIFKFKLPYLGFCLGHQLLADALGSKVMLMEQAEVGILPVDLTDHGIQSSLFHHCARTFCTLQWHGAAVVTAPENSLILASSPACEIQALQVNESAFSMQFHIEITRQTINDWSTIAEYQTSLEKILGEDAKQKLEKLTQPVLPEMNKTAKIIYQNFIKMVQQKYNDTD